VPVVEVDPPADGIGQRAHLLVDLFLHEVMICAFFGRDRVPGHLVGLVDYGLAFQALHLQPMARDHRHLARLEEDYLASVFQDGGQVGGHEVLPLAQADYCSASVSDAGCHDLVRFTRREHHYTVGAFEMGERLAGCFRQRGLGRQVTLDQVDDHLRVRVRVEDRPFIDKILAQFQEIFYDAVMHHHHFTGHAKVWVGVASVWLAVGCPACMSDPQLTVQGRFVYQALKAGKLARVPPDLDVAVLQDRQAGRVVAAVFQPFQSVQDDRRGVTRPDVTYNTAHGNPSEGKFQAPGVM
jgi:hypothetical protein